MNPYGYMSFLNDLIGDNFPIFFAILGVFALILISFYLLKSLAIMKMAQKMEIKNSWLAFVPFARYYTYGKIAFTGRAMAILFLCLSVVFKLLRFWKCFAYVAPAFYRDNIALFSLISTAIIVLERICAVVAFYASYRIFKKFSDKAVVMTIFTVLSCGLLTPIFLFAIRNNELKNEADQAA